MKILVAGSRELNPKKYIGVVLDLADQIRYVECDIEWVTGCAKGIDQIPFYLATSNEGAPEWTRTEFPADWTTHGKAAGPIRNKEMSDYCDAAIIIWDGKSRGTKNMIDLMYKTTKPTIVYKVT